MTPERQKQLEINWQRRRGNVVGVGVDAIPKPLPSARRQYDHKPYGALTEIMECLEEPEEERDWVFD